MIQYVPRRRREALFFTALTMFNGRYNSNAQCNGKCRWRRAGPLPGSCATITAARAS